eukprot:GHVL01028032.1.p2 GENE.GHVL01028032.1~~GHVL01028032.1.p2  ORF type:complete len:180 (+),score=65.50 GHVL01028032.1:36-575(+)
MCIYQTFRKWPEGWTQTDDLPIEVDWGNITGRCYNIVYDPITQCLQLYHELKCLYKVMKEVGMEIDLIDTEKDIYKKLNKIKISAKNAGVKLPRPPKKPEKDEMPEIEKEKDELYTHKNSWTGLESSVHEIDEIEEISDIYESDSDEDEKKKKKKKMILKMMKKKKKKNIKIKVHVSLL